MKTQDGLLKRRVLPTLLGLTLLGGIAAAPAFAQSNHKMNQSTAWEEDDAMFDPAPMSYPQAAPGALHLYHWKDYTQTTISPGSATDRRWENEHKREKKRHERMAAYHRSFSEDPQSDTASMTVADIDTDENGDARAVYISTMSDSPSDSTSYKDIVYWPDKVGITSGNDFVYVLRGNTLYQMRSGDLSLQAQNTLPWLNSQTDYNMPMTAQGEDTDVYNKTYNENTTAGNVDPEQNPDAIPSNDDSDLRSKPAFHRSYGNDIATSSALTPATISASGDYIYILRGNTLFQLRVSDLSLVNQKEIPASGTGTENPGENINPDQPNP